MMEQEGGLTSDEAKKYSRFNFTEVPTIDFAKAPTLSVARRAPQKEPPGVEESPSPIVSQEFSDRLNREEATAFSQWLFEQHPELLPDSTLPPAIQEQQKSEIIAQVISSQVDKELKAENQENGGSFPSIFASENDLDRAQQLLESGTLTMEASTRLKIDSFRLEQQEKQRLLHTFDTKTGLRSLKTTVDFFDSFIKVGGPLLPEGMNQNPQEALEKRKDLLSRVDIIATDLQNMKAANDNIAGQAEVDRCLARIGMGHNYLARLLNFNSESAWDEAVLAPEKIQELTGKEQSESDRQFIDELKNDPRIGELVSQLQPLLEGYLPFRQYFAGDEFIMAFVTKENDEASKTAARIAVDQLADLVLQHIPLQLNPEIKNADTYHDRVRESFTNLFKQAAFHYPQSELVRLNKAVEDKAVEGHFDLMTASLAELIQACGDEEVREAAETTFQIYKNHKFEELFMNFLAQPNNEFLQPLGDNQPFQFGFVGSFVPEPEYLHTLTPEEQKQVAPGFENKIVSENQSQEQLNAILIEPHDALNTVITRALEQGVNNNKNAKTLQELVNAFTGDATDMQRVAPQTFGSRKIADNLNLNLVTKILGEYYARQDPDQQTNPQLRKFIADWQDIKLENTSLGTVRLALEQREQRRSDRRKSE